MLSGAIPGLGSCDEKKWNRNELLFSLANPGLNFLFVLVALTPLVARYARRVLGRAKIHYRATFDVGHPIIRNLTLQSISIEIGSTCGPSSQAAFRI